MRTHRYAVGQHVSYAEDYLPNRIWLGGYEIVSLLPTGNREPQYQIRSDGHTYDQIVWESQLQEEFGRRRRRTRLNKHAMRTTLVLASPDCRARHSCNDPKRTSQHQDLTRWDDEGGAPRSGHHFREQSPPSPPNAERALYYFNVRRESGLVEDPEGEVYLDLQAAQDAAIAQARAAITEGDQKGEDRRSWCIEIMDRANQQVLRVVFADVLDSNAAN